MNLIPDKITSPPNAWCTWSTQNFVVPRHAAGDGLQPGADGAKIARHNLTEALVFGENGWSDQWHDARKDLLLLLDDGWDVPFGIHPDRDLSSFGSLVPDAGRFPSFPGTPEERLCRINQHAKQRGWRGIGIWVAAQAAHEDGMDEAAIRAYWTERLRWSHRAGIEYWKVDWGRHCFDLAFRRMLTELGHEFAPGLLIEHGIGYSPLNDIDCSGAEPTGSGRFANMAPERKAALLELMRFSDVNRIYDTMWPLNVSSSLDRVAFYLQYGSGGILNVEDELYIGASLGCLMGVMRSPHWAIRDYDRIGKYALRGLEAERAVRWQRLAPAFALNDENAAISTRILTDEWTFPPHSTWQTELFNKTVRQHAPAVIARRTPPPTVVAQECEAPFVTASRHPNGCHAVAVHPRLSPQRGLFHPRAEITMRIDSWDRPIGIFGRFARLRLVSEQPVAPGRIWAQDLAQNEAYDVTGHLTVGEYEVTIDGQFPEELCPNRDGDESAPGIVLQINPTERA